MVDAIDKAIYARVNNQALQSGSEADLRVQHYSLDELTRLRKHYASLIANAGSLSFSSATNKEPTL